MCHLATWVIDNNQKEHHGPLWRAWSVSIVLQQLLSFSVHRYRAAKVMRKRPEIEITVSYSRVFPRFAVNMNREQTRHDYEISYPFEWGE